MPHGNVRYSFILKNVYLLEDLVFPSCTTVNPTGTRTRTGCLRQTYGRTQYPIVNYKDVHRELQRSIFHLYDSVSQSFCWGSSLVPVCCRALFITSLILGRLMLFWCRKVSCCVILRCAFCDAVLLLFASEESECLVCLCLAISLDSTKKSALWRRKTLIQTQP